MSCGTDTAEDPFTGGVTLVPKITTTQHDGDAPATVLCTNVQHGETVFCFLCEGDHALENTDFEYSVDSRFTRNEPVDETGAAVKSDLRRQSDQLNSAKLNNYYNSLRKNLEQ
jgi:hypothetical protein